MKKITFVLSVIIVSLLYIHDIAPAQDMPIKNTPEPLKVAESKQESEKRCFSNMRDIRNSVMIYQMENAARKVTLEELISKQYIKKTDAINCPVYRNNPYLLDWTGNNTFVLKCPSHKKTFDEMMELYGNDSQNRIKASNHKQSARPLASLLSAPVKNAASPDADAANAPQSQISGSASISSANPFTEKFIGSLNLLKAVKDGNAGSVKKLLSKGFSGEIRDADGKTILQIATEKGYVEIADMLRNAGYTK